jgi:phosphomannomutase
MPNLFGTSGLRFTFPGSLSYQLLKSLARSMAVSFGDIESVVIARDVRTTSWLISVFLSRALSAAGFNVYDMGVAPLPALAYASERQEHQLGVIITASHNPPNYNGIKIFKKGWELTREEEEKVSENAEPSLAIGNFEGPSPTSALNDYLDALRSHILPRKSRSVLVDVGNGTAAPVTPRLISEAGGDVICVNCDQSGQFPGRLPEPNPINLAGTLSLAKRLSIALGIAHDCDADRVAVFDGRGAFLSQTRILAYFLKKKAEMKRGGTMATTVDVGMAVDDVAKTYNVNVIRTRLGGSHEIAMTRDDVIIFGEPWKIMDPDWGPWADGIKVAVELAEDVMEKEADISSLLSDIPDYPGIREDFNYRKWDVEKLRSASISAFQPQKVEDYDGLKLTFEDGWLLFRKSGTEEKVRLYAEFKTQEKLQEARLSAIRLLKDLGFIARLLCHLLVYRKGLFCYSAPGEILHYSLSSVLAHHLQLVRLAEGVVYGPGYIVWIVTVYVVTAPIGTAWYNLLPEPNHAPRSNYDWFFH